MKPCFFASIWSIDVCAKVHGTGLVSSMCTCLLFVYDSGRPFAAVCCSEQGGSEMRMKKTTANSVIFSIDQTFVVDIIRSKANQMQCYQELLTL